MSEQPDPLLSALGALEREDDRDPPTGWEDVLAGRRSAAEVAATVVGDPEEHAMLAALFTGPVADDEVERLVDKSLATAAGSTAPAPEAAPPPASATVVPFVRRRSTWVGSVLAVAAAVALWVGVEAARPEEVSYHLAVRSQSVQVERGHEETAQKARYRADSWIDLPLMPTRTVTGERVVRVRARGADGEARLLAPPVERSPDGVLRVVGRLDSVLPLTPGRWQLEFIVAAPGAAPADLAAASQWPVAERLELEVLPVE